MNSKVFGDDHIQILVALELRLLCCINDVVCVFLELLCVNLQILALSVVQVLGQYGKLRRARQNVHLALLKHLQGLLGLAHHVHTLETQKNVITLAENK